MRKPYWSFPWWFPLLHLSLEIGPITVRTCVMYYSVAVNTYEYIGLDWRVFKWHGSFGLYTTALRVVRNQVAKRQEKGQ